MHKIKQFILDQQLFDAYSFNMPGENQNIENLAKLNIFIGQNNSGKSRFLRLLAEKDQKFIPNNIDIEKYNDLICKYKVDMKKIVLETRAKDFDGVLSTLDKVSEINKVETKSKVFQPFLDHLNKSANLSNVTNLTGDGNFELINQKAVPKINELARRYHSKAQPIIEGLETLEYHFHRLYIPVLRGLRPLDKHEVEGSFKNTDFYEERTRNDYFLKAQELKIFTGLKLYEETRKLLLGNLSDRSVISEYQNFLSETFFSGQVVALIPSHDKDVLTIKIGDEYERPIHDLGDGIQSIIIQTFPLFANINKYMLVFIEEPELYLHPGLQRKLIETFLDERFKHFQYFITTHSNHFLDLTLDEKNISIYKFEKSIKSEEGQKEFDAKFMIENINNQEMSILNLLGVRNSSIFLSNCTIWVEGITDRYYIRKFFEIYQNDLDNETVFKEDSHYSFVEYSGGNITHWSFLDDENTDEKKEDTFRSIAVEKICNRLFLIADKDGKSKIGRHEKLTEKLGDNYCCLQVREIENILTPTIIRKVINEYEKLESIDDLSFKKSLVQKNYKTGYLGLYIEENLVNQQRKGSYKAESGTVSEKLSFCKKAISHIKSKEDLSYGAIDLCKRIYEFIKNNNPE